MINKITLYLTTASIALTSVVTASDAELLSRETPPPSSLSPQSAASGNTTPATLVAEHIDPRGAATTALQHLQPVLDATRQLQDGLEEAERLYETVAAITPACSPTIGVLSLPLPNFTTVMAEYVAAKDAFEAAIQRLTEHTAEREYALTAGLGETVEATMEEHPQAAAGAKSADVALALGSVFTLARTLASRVSAVRGSLAETAALSKERDGARLELQRTRELAERWNSNICLGQLNTLLEVAEHKVQTHLDAIKRNVDEWQQLMVEKIRLTQALEDVGDVEARLNEIDEEYTATDTAISKLVKIISLLRRYKAVLRKHLQCRLVFEEDGADYEDMQSILTALKILGFLLPNLEVDPEGLDEQNIDDALAYLDMHEESEILEDKRLYLVDANLATSAFVETAKEDAAQKERVMQEREAEFDSARKDSDQLFDEKLETFELLESITDEMVLRAERQGTSMPDEEAALAAGYDPDSESEEETLDPSRMTNAELEEQKHTLTGKLAALESEYEEKNALYEAAHANCLKAQEDSQAAEDTYWKLVDKLDADSREEAEIIGRWTRLQLEMLRTQEMYEQEEDYGLQIPHALSKYRLQEAEAAASPSTWRDDGEGEALAGAGHPQPSGGE